MSKMVSSINEGNILELQTVYWPRCDRPTLRARSDVPVGQSNTTPRPGLLGHVQAISTVTIQHCSCLISLTNCSSLLLCVTSTFTRIL